MPNTFAARLEAWLTALNQTDSAMKSLDMDGLMVAAQNTKEAMVGILQHIDGRMSAIERRLPANDA